VISLATADARHLPFPADTFDVVVSSLVGNPFVRTRLVTAGNRG